MRYVVALAPTVPAFDCDSSQISKEKDDGRSSAAQWHQGSRFDQARPGAALHDDPGRFGRRYYQGRGTGTADGQARRTGGSGWRHAPEYRIGTDQRARTQQEIDRNQPEE